MAKLIIMEGSPGFVNGCDLGQERCTHLCHCSCHVVGSHKDDCCQCTMCPQYQCNRLIIVKLLDEHLKECHGREI